MRDDEYRKMHELENEYWWFVGRKRIVGKQLELLRRNPASTAIINIGSGTGGTVAELERFGTVTNVDTSDEAIAYSAQHNIRVQKVFPGAPLPFPDERFDIAVAFDVLEHIESDQDSLVDWFRVLRPAGRLLITVPAYQWLWSEHDEGLHHYRRYTLSELHRKCNIAGFVVRKRSYAILFSFALVVAFRFLKSLLPSKKRTEEHHHSSDSYVRLPQWLNTVFIWLLYLESVLLTKINLPFGTSIVLVAEKPHA